MRTVDTALVFLTSALTATASASIIVVLSVKGVKTARTTCKRSRRQRNGRPNPDDSTKEKEP